MATGKPKKVGIAKKFEIHYEDKKPENEILRIVPAFGLTRVRELGENPNNVLYYGDNLEIMAHLLRSPDLRGKVQLVYIDPPFASNASYKSRQLVDAYTDFLRGADFLEFLRKRLILIRELMSETASIFVHLDDNMAFPVKVIMDEIFGVKNFRNWITRKKSNPKNFTKKQFGNIADYIMFYTKSDAYTWNQPFEPWDETWATREYPYVEEKTGRRYKKVPVHAPGTRNGETGKPWRSKLPPPGKHWQYSPDKLDELDAAGLIYWSPSGNPRRMVYLDESNGVAMQDIWLKFRDAHNQNIAVTGYPTEKNLDMLKMIVSACSNPGDLVLDAFCGSGTTLVAANEGQRRWIGIDRSPLAIATTINRLLNGSPLMGDFVNREKQETLKQKDWRELVKEHIPKQPPFLSPFQLIASADPDLPALDTLPESDEATDSAL